MTFKYYTTTSDQNCLDDVKKFFDGLSGLERVQAQLYKDDDSPEKGLPFDKVTEIFNHLESSKSWAHVSEWDVEVEYTILHPDGDVVAVDTNTKKSAYLTRRTISRSCKGRCRDDAGSCFQLIRVKSLDIDQLDFNTTLFSSVKILKSKRFHYQTARSSWTFRVTMTWEGETKEDAEKSEKKYFVFVETNDTLIASNSPGYTAASFMEKVIDVISVSHERRQTLMIHD